MLERSRDAPGRGQLELPQPPDAARKAAAVAPHGAAGVCHLHRWRLPRSRSRTIGALKLVQVGARRSDRRIADRTFRVDDAGRQTIARSDHRQVPDEAGRHRPAHSCPRSAGVQGVGRAEVLATVEVGGSADQPGAPGLIKADVADQIRIVRHACRSGGGRGCRRRMKRAVGVASRWHRRWCQPRERYRGRGPARARWCPTSRCRTARCTPPASCPRHPCPGGGTCRRCRRSSRPGRCRRTTSPCRT